VLVERTRQAVSAAVRSSSSHPGPASVETGHASHSLARPFRAHAGGSTPTSRSDDTLLGFTPLQRMKNHGSGHRGLATTRHLPSSAFRAPSTVYSPQLRPGLFRPGNAPGVTSSGPCSTPVVRASLEAGSLLPFRPSHPAAKREGRAATSELCSHRSAVRPGAENPGSPLPS
jgi:hypothetical protein